jgi:signal peptidase I
MPAILVSKYADCPISPNGYTINHPMRKSRPLPDAVSNILLVVALAIIWILFAPIKLGGQVSYVLVDGISMLPNFHTGDLALVRVAPDYKVGDVVAYQDPLMGAHIIHRIIGVNLDRFVLKGDNNSWLDDYQPTRTDILGKLWIHLPKVGLAMEWVRTPIHLALATALLGGLFMVTMTAQRPNKNGKKKSKTSGNSIGSIELFLYIFGFLGLVFLALTIIAFTRPVMRTADAIKYNQIGNFSYSAAGTSTVYDTGAAVSGEPVFTKLTCKLNLGFAYTLQGGNLQNITGTRKIFALVQDPQTGWQRTIPITAETKFSGNTAISQATLDLCQVQALVASVENETDFNLTSDSLVIVAHVVVRGKISGQSFTDTFDPTLTFGFGGVELYLPSNTPGTDPLQKIKPGLINNSGLVENKISFFGLNSSVSRVRIIALIGLGISLAGLLGLWIYFTITSRRDPEAIIRMKYASLLMGVYGAGLESLSPVIDVTSIDDLARLAERQNAMIMHLTHEDVHYYLVQVEGKTYRYMTGQDRSAIPG